MRAANTGIERVNKDGSRSSSGFRRCTGGEMSRRGDDMAFNFTKGSPLTPFSVLKRFLSIQDEYTNACHTPHHIFSIHTHLGESVTRCVECLEHSLVVFDSQDILSDLLI